jgi:hypothetical protein
VNFNTREQKQGTSSSAWLSIPAIIALIAVTGVLSVVLLNYVRPEKDNDALIVQILGFLALVLNLLKSQEVHNLVNSRMTELGEQIGKTEHARGKAEGVREEQENAARVLTERG